MKGAKALTEDFMDMEFSLKHQRKCSGLTETFKIVKGLSGIKCEMFIFIPDKGTEGTV